MAPLGTAGSPPLPGVSSLEGNADERDGDETRKLFLTSESPHVLFPLPSCASLHSPPSLVPVCLQASLKCQSL